MISAWSLTLCATAISPECSLNRFRGTFGVRPESTPVEIRESARLESHFIAHDIDPGAGWITDRLRTRADDVERSVVVLDVASPNRMYLSVPRPVSVTATVMREASARADEMPGGHRRRA